jgi:hypothetical protein
MMHRLQSEIAFVQSSEWHLPVALSRDLQVEFPFKMLSMKVSINYGSAVNDSVYR